MLFAPTQTPDCRTDFMPNITPRITSPKILRKQKKCCVIRTQNSDVSITKLNASKSRTCVEISRHALIGPTFLMRMRDVTTMERQIHVLRGRILKVGADLRKHRSSASLAFVRGIHRGPVHSPHKWPVTWKMFPFGDVIMHENEWDMDDVERTGRLLKDAESRYWIHELDRDGGGVLYADPYAPGSAHLNIRKPRSFSDQGPVCFSFGYKFDGRGAVNLRILASSEDNFSSQNLTLVWSRERPSSQWRQSQVFFLEFFEVAFVRFEADMLYPGIKTYKTSWVHLDDIRWIPGRCPQADETSSSSVDGVSQWEISGGMAVPSTRNVTYRSDWPGRVSAYSWAMTGQEWSITSPYSGQHIASCLMLHYRSERSRSIEFSIWSFQGKRLKRTTKKLSSKYLTWQPFRLIPTSAMFYKEPVMVKITGSATSRDPFFIENPVFYKGSCSSIGCSVGEFQCDSECRPVHLRCDGIVDCQDRSDERECPHTYEYLHVLQPDESGRGVIMSDNYPFMYQKRQYRYVIDVGSRSAQVCFKFQKFELHYDMLDTSQPMDQLIIGFQSGYSNRIHYVGNGDAVRMDMSHDIFDYSDVPARWLSVWGNDTCFAVNHPDRGTTLTILFRTQSFWNFERPNFISPGFYAEYYITSDTTPSISPAPPSCEPQRDFQCYGNATYCIPVDAICGKEPQCPDGSDLSYTHAGCPTGAEDWDMDDAVRTGQLIEISEFWVYRKSDHLALDNGPENDHTNLTGYWPVSDRGGGYIAADGTHSKATLVLPGYTNGETCVNFWYYMNGEGVDRLDVFQESHGSKHGTLRWSRVGSLGKRWRQGQLSVKENSKVYFVAEKVRHCNCVIALDDISRTLGPCQAGEDISTLFNEEENRKWSVGGGARVYDHGRDQYYVESTGSDLTLQSPFAGIAVREYGWAELCFTMSYQYATPQPSSDPGLWQFQLGTRSGSRSGSTEWIKPVTRGPYWRRIVTSMITPSTGSAFHVEIELTRLSSTGDESAIRVRSPVLHYGNCSLVATCLRDEFQCHRSSCVPKTVLCDGIEDCEDGSDEWESNGCPMSTAKLNTIIAVTVASGVILIAFVVAAVVCIQRKQRKSAVGEHLSEELSPSESTARGNIPLSSAVGKQSSEEMPPSYEWTVGMDDMSPSTTSSRTNLTPTTNPTQLTHI